MVQLSLSNKFKIKIKTDDDEYLKEMKNEFSPKAKGYFWSKKYKSGIWDGKIHFITKDSNLIAFGLLLDYIKAHKKLFPTINLEIDREVKELFKGCPIEPKFDLNLEPRPYQKESVEIALKYSKGIIRSATASGKSLAISYIIKNILDNRNLTKVQRALVVVPSTNLVEQFRNDMIDYGLPEQYIGRVYSDYKEWNNAIVISTWQTLKNNHDKISLYMALIGDECHQNKAHELKAIFSKSNAIYRIGFTGTLPNHITDLYNIKSFIGPVLKEYPSGLLAEQGYIAKCNVKIINIDYPIGTIANYYKEIKEEIFNDERRLEILSELINSIDHNVLILVSYINEGDKLLKLLNRKTKKEVVFLSGKDKTEIREEWRKKMINGNNIALIATYGIFQQGINIPNLKYAVLASPTKSKIRTLQSVGRTLRNHENKEDGAIIYDILDNVKFLKKHGEKRIEYYKSEKFNIEFI